MGEFDGQKPSVKITWIIIITAAAADLKIAACFGLFVIRNGIQDGPGAG